MGNAAARKSKEQKRVVLAFGFLVMHQSRSPSHDFNDGIVLAEKVSRSFNAVATQVVQGAASSLGDIPEVRTVRAAVRLSRPNPEDSPYSSLLNGFLCLDDRWRKHFGFGIAVHHS